MADIPPLLLEVGGVEVTRVEWGAAGEEVLGGQGRVTVAVQDRTNTAMYVAGQEVTAKIRSSGWVLGHAKVIRASFELPVGMPFRIWKLECSDFNAELPKRKVGALDGKKWMDSGGFGIFVNFDPFATSLQTDKLTVQQLFGHYVRIFGIALDTSTFVGEFLTNFTAITWDFSDVEAALNDLAALIVYNLQFWIDPDDKVHWVLIPPWQDLTSDLGGIEDDGPLGFPTGSIDLLDIAPYELSDDEFAVGFGSTVIGFQRLTIDYDGSDETEQVYVRGGTSYVYNSPALSPADESKTVVKVPIAGSGATYQLTFLGTTKLWHTDGTGYVSTSFDTAGASGPYTVKYVQIPWSESRNKGGGFWKLMTGPDAGKLVDNDTNVLSGYGSIKVVATTSTPADPKVGVGGSGWVNEVDQDPNKSQTYMEAAISVTKAMRDSYGGQALERGKTATLRGSVEVVGYDGWRAGQLMKITDVRLPAELNGRYFVIQRVRWGFLAETELRKYTLDFGDGPVSRWSGKPANLGDVEWPPGAILVDISARDLSPGPNSTQIIKGQLLNGVGQPWAIAGKTVEWSFEAYNAAGVLQVGQGHIDPEVSVTDKHGAARTRLTTGAATGLVYYMFAHVKAV